MIVTPPVWLNGQPQASDSTPLYQNRGLHYGDGVFRTMLLSAGVIVDLDGQLAQLLSDAQRLGLETPDVSVLNAEISAARTGVSDAVIKLMLTRVAGGRGYRPASDAVDRWLLIYPLPSFPISFWQQGIVAARAKIALAQQPQLAGIKHLNRLEQVLASRHWPEGVDEILHEDGAGQVICGNRTNLFWVRNGVLHTPDLSRCGVAGRMRARIRVLAEEAGLRVQLGEYGWDALISADEAFVTNSVIGIWPLRQFEVRHWRTPGLLTDRLQRMLAHPRIATE